MSLMIVWKHLVDMFSMVRYPVCNVLRIHVVVIMYSSVQLYLCSGIGCDSCAKIRIFVKIANRAVAFNSENGAEVRGYATKALTDTFQKKGVPKHSRIHEIHIEIQRLQVKKIIRERLIRVHRCYPCFIFLTGGHRRRLMDTMLSHRNPFPLLTSCPRPSAWTNQRKKTLISRTLHGSLFHGFFL